MARTVRKSRMKSEDERADFRLENDPRFLKRIESARAGLRAGRGVKLEDL